MKTMTKPYEEEGARELTGDWVVPSLKELQDLVAFAGRRLSPAAIEELVRRPAVKELNFDIRLPSGCREIGSLQVVDGTVRFSLFTVVGNTAIRRYGANVWTDEEGVKTSIECPEEPDWERLQTKTLRFFAAFVAVQHIMLHGSGEVKERREYRKGLRSGLPLERPYTKPGKVRLLEIRLLEICVSERAIGRNAWHCPAWGVRGHYRHYSNGTVAYVKPYVKGRERSAYVGREYELPKRGEAQCGS